MDFAVEVIGEVFGVDKETSFTIFIGLLSIFVGFFIILFVFLRRKPKKKVIVIAGQSDSGKTVLFSRLITNGKANPLTVTSQKENVFDEYTTKIVGKTLSLIDIPGADKIRGTILNSNLKKSPISGLIYVVDSSTVIKDCREIAEYLYELLADTSSIVDRRNFPILIVCNKQDLPTAKSSKVVKSSLEKEFALLNQTRAAALDNIGKDSNRKNVLAEPGKEFLFKQLVQKIEFVECSAKSSLAMNQNAVNIENVEKWLDSI